MILPYKLSQFVFDLPTRCDFCPRILTGNGIKLKLDGKYDQNFHESCAEKVKKLLDDGFVFIQNLPLITLAKPKDDGFVILYKKQECFFKPEAFEKQYRMFKKD